MSADLAVVVVAGALRGGALERVLVSRAARWALEHAPPGMAYVAHAPGDAEAIAALAPDGVEPFAQDGAHPGLRLAGAFAEAAARSGRPVALVGTEMPLLGDHHAWAAADDLRAGVDVTFGPATDGRYYLVAAPEPHPSLFAIDAEAWGGERVMALTLESVLGAGLSSGWLRSERHLTTPADAAALLADPLAPADVVTALRT